MTISNLAFILIEGAEGVPVDNPKAVDLVERATDTGNEYFMVHLARLLSRGADGVDMDTARAVELYTRVIEEGNNSRPLRKALVERSAFQQRQLNNNV